ncbi:MAG: TetR family transcriptional regulator C-terminal domain-containing protein [Pseudomonadota bacterium]
MSILEPRTRIQRKNHNAILEAALDVFSQQGFNAATIDRIAAEAGMSKPNLLYYFPSKDAVFETLMASLLKTWLNPLQSVNAKSNDPVEEILRYVNRKLQMSAEMPRQSRLFAHEILDGAPRISNVLRTELKTLVDEKAAVIAAWVDTGRLAPLDPHHLIFSIWSLTQHYADFDVQVRAVLGDGRDPFSEAQTHLETMFRRMLTPTTV